MDKGRPYTYTRWRQEEPAPNAEPNMVELTTPQPFTVELYYSAYGKIDRHNSCRQESLDIENKVGYLRLLKVVQYIYFCDEFGRGLVGIPRHHCNGRDPS